jgi:hypothetical protein
MEYLLVTQAQRFGELGQHIDGYGQESFEG